MIKSFTVGVKHHVNLGNYESMEVEAQVTVDVEDHDWEIVRQQAQDGLKQLLSDSYRLQKRPEWFNEIPSKRGRVPPVGAK
ncbi:MAG TPA: hypothetical protein VF748_12140 [Candidatus Acidoferrum sp.]